MARVRSPTLTSVRAGYWSHWTFCEIAGAFGVVAGAGSAVTWRAAGAGRGAGATASNGRSGCPVMPFATSRSDCTAPRFVERSPTAPVVARNDHVTVDPLAVQNTSPSTRWVAVQVTVN